jgi:hypothetical protein
MNATNEKLTKNPGFSPPLYQRDEDDEGSKYANYDYTYRVYFVL